MGTLQPWPVTMDALYSRAKVAYVVFMDECPKMVRSTLPFVLLKSHVNMMVLKMHARRNRTKLSMLGGVSQNGIKNRGRCHNAHTGPRMRLPTNGPCNACRRGSANPRQPTSSFSPPPSKT